MGLSGFAGSSKELITISGNFLSEKNVQCQIFLINDNKQINKKMDVNFGQEFKIQLSPDSNYVIKFINKSGNEKFFYFYSKQSIFLLLTVDFSSKASAIFSYNSWSYYKFEKIEKEEQQAYFN